MRTIPSCDDLESNQNLPLTKPRSASGIEPNNFFYGCMP